MSLLMILLIVALVIMFGGFTPYVRQRYNYYPSGLGIILLLIVLFLLFGHRI